MRALFQFTHKYTENDIKNYNCVNFNLYSVFKLQMATILRANVKAQTVKLHIKWVNVFGIYRRYASLDGAIKLHYYMKRRCSCFNIFEFSQTNFYKCFYESACNFYIYIELIFAWDACVEIYAAFESLNCGSIPYVQDLTGDICEM